MDSTQLALTEVSDSFAAAPGACAGLSLLGALAGLAMTAMSYRRRQTR